MSYFLIGLPKEQVEKVVLAFNEGESEVMVKGRKIFLNNLLELVVYDTSKVQAYTEDDIDREATKINNLFYSGKMSIGVYKEMGINVTDEFQIGEKIKKQPPNEKIYVSSERIEELRQLSTTKFDLTKLIRLCEELNSSNRMQNWFAVGALVRAIIDHIPPIFNYKNFSEVANNYSAPGKARSFKPSMDHLENSMRKISDSFLHSQITKSETLPNEMQVDCKRDLDVLLEEVIRTLK